jgi:non-reducing end alpha-L-arabinofuranosidase
VADFAAGQTIMIDTSASLETAVIVTVGTAGATAVGATTTVGATVIPVASGTGFSASQTITIDGGANQETAVVASTTGGRGGATITVAAPLTFAHAAGVQVSGSGITLTAALTLAHAGGAQVAGSVPTPGAPNRYYIPVAYVNPPARVSGSAPTPTVPARPPALVMIPMRRFWMR